MSVTQHTDLIVFLLVSLAWVAGTTFLFMHPSDMNFGTWAAFSTTITGVYHWIVMKDQKIPDAGG